MVLSKFYKIECGRQSLLPGSSSGTRTTDNQWKHKSKISEKLGRCGRQNIVLPYLKIWDWNWIFGRAVKTISSMGVRSPWDSLIFECVNVMLQNGQPIYTQHNFYFTSFNICLLFHCITPLLNEGIPRALKGKKLRLKIPWYCPRFLNSF